MSLPDKDFTGPVYQDFRQMLALNGSRPVPRCGSFAWLKQSCSRCLEDVAGLLESRMGLYMAVCLCVVLVGVSSVSIHRRTSGQSTKATAVEYRAPKKVPVEAAESSAEDSDRNVENSSRYRAVSYSASLPPGRQASPGGLFVVRVGSFRDPSNAERVAASLRPQTPGVQTEVLAGGLYVVSLGPFSQKSDAEDAARALQEKKGLSPQVLRKSLQ